MLPRTVYIAYVTHAISRKVADALRRMHGHKGDDDSILEHGCCGLPGFDARQGHKSRTACALVTIPLNSTQGHAKS
jgi:hypothetical protein